MNNTTLLLLQETTKQELPNIHDTTGAIIFIIVVLLWYSLSALILLGMEMRKPFELVDDSFESSRKLFTHNFHEKTNNKKVLEELASTENRKKLWDIYLGSSGDMKNKIINEETIRIRNIQRQLLTLNSCDDDDNKKNDNSLNPNFRLSVPDVSSGNIRLGMHRRSSLDPEVLARWRETFVTLQTRENQRSPVQKLLKRRRLQ